MECFVIVKGCFPPPTATVVNAFIHLSGSTAGPRFMLLSLSASSSVLTLVHLTLSDLPAATSVRSLMRSELCTSARVSDSVRSPA